MFVLVHGGGFAGSCWDRMVPLLDGPVHAVDMPGRGVRPRDLATVTLDDFVDAVVDDITSQDLSDVVLVGHSAAGMSMAGVTERVGDRLRRLVFVSCMVPEHGKTGMDMFDDTMHAAVKDIPQEHVSNVLPESVSRWWFANDMDDEQFQFMQWCMGPEALRTTRAPVDLTGYRHPVPRTWVRLLKDNALSLEQQARFAANAGIEEVVDLDAGHMAMISRPAELAAILNELARRP